MISGAWKFLRALFRPTWSDLRVICEFISAIENEVAHDLYQLRTAGIDCNACPSLPRPAKWVAIYNEYPKILTAMDRFFSIFWIFFGILLFFFEHFRFSSVVSGKVKPDPKGQVLVFSHRCADLVSSNRSASIPSQLVTFPWLTVNKGIESDLIFDSRVLLNDSVLSRVLALSILSHFILMKSNYSRHFFFQSYTAWRWYYARLSLINLPGPFLIAEHFDRWAVLADKVVGQRNKQYGNQSFTLLQHGSVNAETAEVSIGFEIPTKLCNVTEVYLYSNSDYEVFLRDILCSRKSKPALNYLLPELKLRFLESDGRFNLLVVGHPLCENIHADFVRWLLQCHDVNIWYKPHPLAKESKLIATAECKIIHDKYFYPRVNLVISYPSTLVREYKIAGVEVFEHKMRPTSEEYEDLKMRVSNFIAGLSHTNL